MSTPEIPDAPHNGQTPVRKHWELFAEHSLQAMRTAGALLIGNSALIGVGVLGTKPLWITLAVLAIGIFGVFFGSVTPAFKSERAKYKKAKKAHNSKNGVKLPNQQNEGEQ